MEDLIKSWRDNSDIFLMEGDRSYSYAQLFSSVELVRQELQTLSENHGSVGLIGSNDWPFFVSFVAASTEVRAALPILRYQYFNQEYRQFASDETATDFLFRSQDVASDRSDSSEHWQ